MLPSKNSLSYLQPYDLEEGEIVEDEEEEEIFSDTLSQTDVCFTPENNIHTGSLHQNSNKNLSIDIVSKESKYANNCTPRGYEFLLKQNLPTCKKSSVQKLSSKAQRWALPVRKDGVSNPLHASEMRDRSRSDDSYSCSSSSSCSCSSCSCSSSSYEDAKATSESKDLHHIPKKCLRIPNRHQVKDKDVHTNNNLKYGNFDKPRSSPTAIRYKQFTNEDRYISKPERTRGIIDSRFRHRRRQRNENWRHSFGKPRPAKPHLIVSKDNFKPSDTSTNKVYNKSSKEKKRIDIHDKTLKENKDTTALERFASNIANEPVKKKIVPGSIGEMLLKFKLRANSKLNESKNLPSSNELETSKISENEGEQGRNEKVIVDSLNNLKGTVTAQSLADVNDDEDELTLRYKALQSAMKGCATSPTIEAQLLKLCNFLSNQDSKSCKIAGKNSFGTEGDMKESSKSLGLNEFLTKHASEIEAVDMEISNDSFTDIHEEKDQQQKNLLKVDECSNDTAASHQVIYKSSHLESQLPIPIEWAYMIPPPPKPNQPNNNFTSIDSWCYNQNMYIQSMQDTVHKKEGHLWYPMNPASLSSENSQAHSQSFLNPMPAEDSSVSSPKELCKADSANMSDILAPGDGSELRDLHAEQYKSFMSTVISENRKKGKAHKGDYRDLVKINLRPLGKSNSQTAHPNLPKGKLGKKNRKRRRNSKKGINVSANISKKKELANPIGENIFDDDDDEDLLRAQLLNEMTLKSQTNRLKNENMPTSLKDQSSNSLKTTTNQKSNLKRLQPLPEPQRKEWVKEKRLVKANLSKKLDKPSVRLDIGGRYLDTKNKFPDAPPVTGFSLSSFPPVKPVIIPLGKDSDDSETEPEPVSISAPKNANLISEINSFIRSFRYSQDKARASEGKPISKAQSSSTSEVKTPKMLNHLSRERQEEYKHLKALFNAKKETLQQRTKIQKKNAVSPQLKKMPAVLPLESSKPKPKIPKPQQREKEHGTSGFVKTGEEQPVGHSLPEVKKCSEAENHNQRKEYSFDYSSSVPACSSRLELPPPERSASICTTTEKTSGILRNVHKVCELELNEESIGICDSGLCITQQKVGNDCSLIRKLNSCEEYKKNANIKLRGGEEDQLNIQLQRENGEIILSLCSENDEKAYTEDGIADSSQDSVQIVNESLNDGKWQSSSQDSKITREISSLDRLNIDSANYNKNKTLIASKEHDNDSDLQLALVTVIEKNILTLPSKPIVLNEDYVAITEQPHESEEKISDSKVKNFSDSSDENSSSSSDSSSASSFSSDDSDSESEKDQEEINFRNRLLQKRNALLQNSEEVTDKTANEVLPVSDSGEHLGLLGHLAGNSTKDELRQDNSQDNKTTSSDELTKMRQSLTKALDINSLIRHGREMFSKNTKQDSENHVDDFKLKLDHCLQTTAINIDKSVERVVTSSSSPLWSQSKMSSEKKEQFMRKVCNINLCKKNIKETTVSNGLVSLQKDAETKMTGENEKSLNNDTLQNSNIPTIYGENADGVKEGNSKENIDDIGKFKKMGATENTSISNIVKKDVPVEDYACIQYKNTSQNTFSEQVNTVEIAKAVKSKHPTGESQVLLNHKSIYMPTKTSMNSSMSHKVVGKVLPTTQQNEAITIQKQRQEELKKAFLAKSMVINRISALLEEASEDEKMCQTLFTKVVKLFSEMETLIKKRKERSSAVNVNVAKAVRLVQKLNDDIQLSVKIEKQLTAADRDFPIYAKIRDSNVKDEEQMKKFNIQINALKKSLNFTATQENILMQALSKRFILSAKQEPRPLAQKVTRNFKLDNRVTKGQDRVEGACVQPLRPIIPPKDLVKKGVTDCLSTPPSSYQYFKPHISPKPLHASQQNTKKNVEDSGILCPYELLGRCNDDHCTFNHPDVAVEVRDAETGNPEPTPALLPVPKVLDKLSETTSAEVTSSLMTSSNLSLGFQITEPTQVMATESASTKVSSHSIGSLGLNKHVCEIASQGECTDSKKNQDNTLIKKPCAHEENILEDIPKEHTEEGNAEKAASIDDISLQELHTKESDCSKRKKSESFKSRKRRSGASKDDNLFAKDSDDNSRVANPSVKELIASIPSECSVLKQNLDLKDKRLNRLNISTIQSQSSGKLIKKTSGCNSNKSQANCIAMTLEEDLNEQPLQKGNENAHQLKKNVARRCSMKKDEMRDSRKGSLQRHSSGKCIARKQRGVRSSMNVRRYSPRIKAKQKSKTNVPS